jgi:hypothetical protein
MMKKGKGYPFHVKDTQKGYGDAYAQEITGGRNIRSELNQWDDYSWEAPEPIKPSRKSTIYN